MFSLYNSYTTKVKLNDDYNRSQQMGVLCLVVFSGFHSKHIKFDETKNNATRMMTKKRNNKFAW